ncbi:MAG: alpha/beta hydrolase [Balneolaceae bacterium]|nr:alpha/beta hydrolase [Balneolaceae bacterium]
MKKQIFKNEGAKARMEDWYERFLNRSAISAKSIEVPTSFGSSHLLIAGNPDKPPLVCLHSMLTSSAHLLSELDRLFDQFYLIIPDIPGQSVRGLPLRLSYTDDSHARWLKEILDGLKLKKVQLFGVSLGGFVGRQFASLNPERTESLALLVPAGIVQGSMLKGFAEMALPMVLYRIHPSEKNLSRLVHPLMTTWDDDWVHYLGDSFRDFVPNLKIPPLASDNELKKLTMPCLIVAAEYDISFPGRRLLERVINAIPGSETELIKDSRHCPPTTPEFRRWLAKRMISFLN